MVKIEQNNGHFNYPQRGSISFYYVFKLGAFWQNIEGKSLRDINYGSIYSFPWEGFFPTGINTGFIGHVTEVMNNTDPAAYDYAFIPVVNESGLAGQDASNCIINCCAPLGAGIIPTRFTPDHTAGTSKLYYNQFSPFPYHHFILKHLFDSFNWSIKGDPLEDPDFKKTVLVHGGAIPYRSTAAIGSVDIEWDFRNILPKVGLGNYLISLANQFGWWFDFDDNSRTCIVRYRKDFLTNRKKRDYTGKSGALYNSRISTGKIYRMERAGAGEKIDFTYLQYQGEVNNQYGLPSPSTSIQNHTYLVRSENAWYNCVVDTSNVATWEKSSDNVINFVPDGATESVSTNLQLPGTVFIPYRNTSLSELPNKVVLPVVGVSDTAEEQVSFYSIFNHGPQNTINNASLSDYLYPYGSAINYTPNGARVGNYALTFEFKNGSGDDGIYKNFFELFLHFIKQKELVTAQLNWTMIDLLNFNYQDTIVIRNTEYLVSNISPKLPLPELTEAELLRVV